MVLKFILEIQLILKLIKIYSLRKQLIVMMSWGEPSVNHVLPRMHVKADYNLDYRCLGQGVFLDMDI